MTRLPVCTVMDCQPHCYLGYIDSDSSAEILNATVLRLLEPLKAAGANQLSGKTILIKPDLSRNPSGALRTDPNIIIAVGRFFNDQNCRVRVGDSPLDLCLSSPPDPSLSELAGLLHDNSIDLVSFEAEGCSVRAMESHAFYIANPVTDADFVVNLAPVRIDPRYRLHAGIANLLGVLPGFQKARLISSAPYRRQFVRLAVDVFAAAQPNMTFLYSSAGGSAGRGLVMGWSYDTVAIDSWLASAMGMSHDLVPMIKLASEAGLGIAWSEALTLHEMTPIPANVTPMPKNDGSTPRRRSGILRDILSPFIWARPRVNRGLCRDNCSICSQNCPTQAITLSKSGNGIEVLADLCLGCWQCCAICPTNAIEIENSMIASKLLC